MEIKARIFRKFRWFWAWDDEKEENWLRDMSNQGYHLKAIGYPGIYTFKEGEKKDYVYRLDYSPELKKKEDYFNLFKDAGWTYLGNMNYWHYFRKEVTGPVAPEIFTDYESKISKYKRIISLLAALLPLMVVNVINCGDRADQPFWLVLAVFFGVILILFLYGIWKLLKRINALKHF